MPKKRALYYTVFGLLLTAAVLYILFGQTRKSTGLFMHTLRFDSFPDEKFEITALFATHSQKIYLAVSKWTDDQENYDVVGYESKAVLYTSVNKGQSFARQYFGKGAISSITENQEGDLFLLHQVKSFCDNHSCRISSIYKSNDQGNSWKIIYKTSDFLKQIIPVTGDSVILVGNNIPAGEVYVATDIHLLNYNSGKISHLLSGENFESGVLNQHKLYILDFQNFYTKTIGKIRIYNLHDGQLHEFSNWEEDDRVIAQFAGLNQSHYCIIFRNNSTWLLKFINGKITETVRIPQQVRQILHTRIVGSNIYLFTGDNVIRYNQNDKRWYRYNESPGNQFVHSAGDRFFIGNYQYVEQPIIFGFWEKE